MLITDLPAETLDYIASALDSPVDLGNLSATCFRLHLIVSPNHIDLRIIRTPLVSPLWQELSNNRHLSQNVRVLEIQSAEPYGRQIDVPRIPGIYRDVQSREEIAAPHGAELHEDEDEDDEDDIQKLRELEMEKNKADLAAERALVCALRGMSGLKSFQWNRTPPLIKPSKEDDDIWTTLSKYCPALTSVSVLDREKPFDFDLETNDHSAYYRPTLNSAFYLFEDLRVFSLKTEAFNVGNYPVSDFDRGMKMLVEKCPNLEVLNLQFVLYANPHSKAIPATRLLSGQVWKFLREVTLQSFSFTSDELGSFLAVHPTIEALSIHGCTVQGQLLPESGTLPSLKRLSSHTDVIHAVLDSKTPVPRPLESIDGALLNEEFLIKLEQTGSGSTLTKLSTRCSNRDNLGTLVSRLSEVSSNIQFLHIRCSPQTPIDHSLYRYFGQLPHLHTLLGVRVLDSQCREPSANTEAIKALVTVCPNLRRLDWFMGEHYSDDLGIVIEKCGSHISWSVRYILRKVTVGDICTSWGERGCGSFEL